jgi:DNA modification methylase
MAEMPDQSVDLFITSPPYPMIEMWDDFFTRVDPDIGRSLNDGDGQPAFEKMHAYLDTIWKQSCRVMKPGGIMCLNIGDAVRTFKGVFQLYANHARIISAFCSFDCIQLPGILWRKPTNAPNKFMGSGMLPPSAYVTLEHEHILIFRKAGKRTFKDAASRQIRRENAYFWEERNNWFSDVWFNLIGASQALGENKSRERSGAFPLELPYRLIHMFSLRGDMVLDPFLGTGTTLIAAMCAGRNALGYEIDQSLHPIILTRLAAVPDLSQALTRQRFESHLSYMNNRIKTKGIHKYQNRMYGIPVVTRQEEGLVLDCIQNVQFLTKKRFRAAHGPWRPDQRSPGEPLQPMTKLPGLDVKARQLKLF